MTVLNHIRFEEPPAKSASATKTKHQKIVEKLVKRPGEWALIAAYTTPASMNSMAYVIRRGGLKAYEPAGAFEAVARTTDGKHRVWARYVGRSGEHK